MGITFGEYTKEIIIDKKVFPILISLRQKNKETQKETGGYLYSNTKIISNFKECKNVSYYASLAYQPEVGCRKSVENYNILIPVHTHRMVCLPSKGDIEKFKYQNLQFIGIIGSYQFETKILTALGLYSFDKFILNGNTARRINNYYGAILKLD